MVAAVALFDIDGTLVHARGAGNLGACRALKSAFGAEPTSGNINFAGRKTLPGDVHFEAAEPAVKNFEWEVKFLNNILLD